MAIVDLSYKIGAAIASFLAGALLSAIGYVESADSQSQPVIDGINMISTVPAAVTFIVAGIIIFLYPVTKQKYNALV